MEFTLIILLNQHPVNSSVLPLAVGLTANRRIIAVIVGLKIPAIPRGNHLENI